MSGHELPGLDLRILGRDCRLMRLAAATVGVLLVATACASSESAEPLGAGSSPVSIQRDVDPHLLDLAVMQVRQEVESQHLFSDSTIIQRMFEACELFDNELSAADISELLVDYVEAHSGSEHADFYEQWADAQAVMVGVGVGAVCPEYLDEL